MDGFSIIICCYNSSTKIELTLKYLKDLKLIDNLPYEIIVIDNGSSDNTREIIQSVVKNINLSICLVNQPEIGKAKAMKLGFSLAKYEFIVICDDDVGLSKNYLQLAYNILKNDMQIGVIGGYGILETVWFDLPYWFDKFMGSFALGSQSIKEGDITNLEGAVWGAGMIFRKSAWLQLIDIGFKDFLTGRKGSSVLMAGEDTEMCLLFRFLNYKIYYSKHLIYRHNVTKERINWRSIIDLHEGFSRSQLYFDLYNKIFFEKNYEPIKFENYFISNLYLFLKDFPRLIWFKRMYIAFVQNREGYTYGLEIKKYLYKLMELWRIRSDFYRIISIIESYKQKSNCYQRYQL